jgi:AcrR family transcriptional regulator
MERARSGILTAAAELVAAGGSGAVTMSSVARRAAVAKATVYNHFRDRGELLDALVVAQGERLVAHCLAAPPDEHLRTAADFVSRSPELAGLRRHDPAALVDLVEVVAASDRAKAVVATWCAADADADDALRWLLSFAMVPSGSDDSSAGGSAYPAP